MVWTAVRESGRASGNGRAEAALSVGAIEALVALAARSPIAELCVEVGGARVTVTTRREAERTWQYAVCAQSVGVVRWPAGAEPRAGAGVRAGSVIAHVEALGLRQEVRAPTSGEVAGVLAAEGEAVEYGQPLAILRVTMA